MTSFAKSRIAWNARLAAWIPLVALPVVVLLTASAWPPWLFMGLLAVSIYAGFKWLSFADSRAATESTMGRKLGYLLFWPGMDANSFFARSRSVELLRRREWLLAILKTTIGILLILIAGKLVNPHPRIAGWSGMIGIVFMLHFGLFHLLSLAWRRAGVDAPPIMNSPLLATSLSDFWGKRWNLAFRDLTHAYVFRPFAAKLGVAGATMAAFLASGIVHDLVISIPAGGGFGLPTFYFLLHGTGLLCEHSRPGRQFGLGKGVVGRLFGVAVTLGPVFLLFHSPFVDRVVVPMLTEIGRIGS